METIGADPVQPTPAAPSAAPGAMEGPVRPGAQHEPATESATNPAPPAETTPAHAETQSAVHAGAPAVAAAPSPTPGPQPHQSAPNPVAVATITLPNLLTAFRCVMVFLIVVLLMWPWGPLLTGALVVFAIAAATDWLDGVLARAFNLQTDLGRMLDHIADKLLVCVTMLCLCATGVIDGLNVLAVALILSRELAISGLREHLGARGVVVPSTMFGKWKTTFQMVAVAALLAAPLAPLAGVARFSGLMILWVAMVLTVASGVQYALATREAWGKS
ncbi:MAG: CDP-diacylglycerol--glycerol-3-phosphate 3-phosphatidyltransferase [Pseudomonadota bacterium]